MDIVRALLLAKSIIAQLKAEGHEAFLVGGCVRDLLLRRTPKDFDVATSATPSELLRLFPKADRVGAHFGVVLVHEDGFHVEVATYRRDGEYADGRRPTEVTFETDARDDSMRRDFTLNALFMDPVTEEIVDYTGGQADLERRLIRAVGNPERRFGEDHLRLLRAVRFAARLGFEIEPETFAAIRSMAALVTRVAPERTRDEISRILTEGGAKRGFELLDETGLLDRVLPEVAAMKGVQQPPEFHPEGDVWVHTLMMLEQMQNPSLPLALGVLLHDVGKPATFKMSDRIRFNGHVERGVEIAHALLFRLRFPNQVIDQVEALIANHMKFKDVPRMRESTLKRFLRLPDFEEHMQLHRLDLPFEPWWSPELRPCPEQAARNTARRASAGSASHRQRFNRSRPQARSHLRCGACRNRRRSTGRPHSVERGGFATGAAEDLTHISRIRFETAVHVMFLRPILIEKRAHASNRLVRAPIARSKLCYAPT